MIWIKAKNNCFFFIFIVLNIKTQVVFTYNFLVYVLFFFL